MKKIKQISLSVCFLWLVACSPEPKRGAAASAASVPEQASAVSEVQDAGKKGVWGLYTYGHEVSAFAPCGEKHDFWADGTEEVMKPLEEASMKLAEERKQPYQPVLARLQISEPVKAAEGFPADYEGAVTVEKVEELVADRQTCTEHLN
ncbi:hypothetical protein [Neisseria wadsworthii]|uniref:hypothetical protein n=1 Tax=Neisseria wadsworthii TaxID=607711 RepID=UPI000D303EE1|nr:hypothetical protein [Neisseria wadsworthii]